jgi:CHAT domain-containing protein
VEDVDRALGVIERMRARVLLDTLDAAGASSHDVNGPLQAQRAGILRDIARVQRTLLDPALSEEDRAGRMSDLDRLEAREVTSRREMALADPWFARLRAPVIPTLRDLQAALAPEEALVSFQSQLKGSEAGWAVVLTRSDVHTYAIPTRAALRDEVALFLGLVERRDGSEGPGAARLYRELLGDALKDLPPDVRRLVLVPDGPLNGIPWDVLRSDAAAAPLASRYETALAPSCTLWLRWKRTPAGDTRDPVLAVADPILSTGGPVAAASRSATLASALRLGPLPRAREEARALVSELGGGSRLMIGENATERSLKRADLPRFRMLHLAAHTVVDDEHPERSAVLLAPGGDDEDGLLQMREIVQLDLKGAVVVLSSCRSASGAMVEGEGVIGLAHAFFQAGAVAVIGGLWPLRDDETARLVERMAVHLGQGSSLSSALQQARLDRIAAGAPPQAWAGLVLLGNGDLVPLPGGRPTRFSAALAFFCAFLALLTGATLFFRRRRAPREIRVPS